MTRQGKPAYFRVGLQAKAVAILTCVILGVALSGGWFYFETTRRLLRRQDQQRGMRIAHSLSLAAQHDLREFRADHLQRLVNEYLRNDDVCYAAVLDRGGRVLASAARDEEFSRAARAVETAAAVSTTRRVTGDLLVVARPIISRDVTWYEDRLGGAVRVVLDTRSTTAKLAQVRRSLALVAAGIIACAAAAGHMLVWRTLGGPIRKLVRATRRLGQGDFTARASVNRNDEIGQLGAAFDSMASQVAQMRDALIEANEQLEQQVAQRTAELETANRRLVEEIDEKEDFLRAVSHDLGAPLRNIAGTATVMMTKWRHDMPAQAVERLERIRANVEVETSLIQELLELSRIRSMPQQRQLVDMGMMMHELARMFEYELTERSITLEIASPMPELYVASNRVRQAFQNLIDNAVKYMDRPEGGLIRVGYELVEGEHVFSVADNGPGIPADEQARVFYVFRRIRGEAAAKVAGKGVGLALVKSVAAGNGGRAWVKSQGGEGSTFHVSFSASKTAPPEPARQAVREDRRPEPTRQGASA